VNHVTLAHEDNCFTSLPHLSISSQKFTSTGFSHQENDADSKYKPSEEKVQPDTASVMHRHEAKNGISTRLYFSATFPIAGATVSYPERRLLSPEPISLEESLQPGLAVSSPSEPVDWDARREEVKQAFVTSWEANEKYAWG
jgi:hypothetical protein